jgi:hydrogenase nickel incorporation protein HypA/HybF
MNIGKQLQKESRMHELAVTEAILKVVLKHAMMNGAGRVVTISLRIGELTDLADEWLQRYFEYLSRDTIAAGAQIHIERVPIIFRCEGCGKDFPVRLGEMKNIACPACDSAKATLLSGREFTVRQIEVV